MCIRDSLKAFGSYAFRVSDAVVFLKEIAGTDGEFTVEEINEQLRNIAVSVSYTHLHSVP